MTPRREMAVSLGLVVLGAAIALVGAGRSSGIAPGSVPTGSGADSGTAAPTALALVALAGAAATLLVRNWARTVLGLVLLAVAVALAAAGLSPTRWAALAGGALVATRRRGGRRRGPAAGRSRVGASSRPRADRPATPRDTWDALDRGEDPTA